MAVRKSKIIFNGLMLAVVLSCVSVRHTQAFSNVNFYGSLSSASCFVKRAGNYIFSWRGAGDAVGAYCLGMGLTTIHELGHAIVAKMVYGSPLDITLGRRSSRGATRRPYLRIGCFKLRGFNPATAYARITLQADDERPLKDAVICIAGPVCGAVSSLLAFYALKKIGNYPLCNLVALYGLFNHTLGLAGLASIRSPDSDLGRIVRDIRAIRNNL